MPDRDELTPLIDAVRAPETARRITAAARRLWPGGPSDRTRPAAREWVRRWRPRHPVSAADLPVCACAAGRCAICN